MEGSSLIGAIEDVLLQGQTFLRGLDDKTYACPLEGPLVSSLGAHYRHVLDHFTCLLEGIRSGAIDYDHRRRNPAVEASVAVSAEATGQLLEEFRNLRAEDLRRECNVIYSVGYALESVEEVRSNLAREVMFCVGHAIHHYAIVKLLCSGLGIRLPYEFGVAPSTLKHLESPASA